MRVCVLYAGANKDAPRLKELSEALAKGIEEDGNSCDVFNMALEDGKKVSFYDYIVIGTESTSFFGAKLPPAIRQFLKSAGTLSGKRCMAFARKSGFRSQKTVQLLMKSMEGEGMYLRSSEVLTKTDMAYSIGKHLKIGK